MKLFDFFNKKIKTTKKVDNKAFERNYYNDKFLKFYYLKLYDDLQKEFQLEKNCYDLGGCPNCGIVLETKIIKTQKCPNCGKKIIKRNSTLTHENYLLTEDGFKKFDKINELKKRINYCENICNRLSYNNDFKQYINNNYEIEENPAHLIWNYCWKKADNLQVKAFKMFVANQKKDFYKDYSPFFECEELYKQSLIYEKVELELLMYQDKYYVFISNFVNYLYHSVNVFEIPFTYDEGKKINSEKIIEHLCFEMNSYIEYIKKYTNKISDIKHEFYTTIGTFTIQLITIDLMWELLEMSLKKYNFKD